MWCRYEQSYHRFIENSVRVYLILVENLVKSLRIIFVLSSTSFAINAIYSVIIQFNNLC